MSDKGVVTSIGRGGDLITVGFRNSNGDFLREVRATATVTLNGVPAGVKDIRHGDTIQFSGLPATSIVLTR